ncbi:hypothetical protein Ac2012v2_001142 [Leucoagaricus gongylophorus]
MAVEEKRPRISDWEELRLAGARLTHYSQGHTVFSTRTLAKMNELFSFLRARPKWFRRLKLRIGQDSMISC